MFTYSDSVHMVIDLRESGMKIYEIIIFLNMHRFPMKTHGTWNPVSINRILKTREIQLESERRAINKAFDKAYPVLVAPSESCLEQLRAELESMWGE